MNTVIYYFSATGNSLVVARRIAAALGDTDVVRMEPDAEILSPPAVERIGLVFPVIVFGLPLIVRRFIQRLRVPEGIYLFAVATCGGMPCATLKETERLFAERGMRLAAGFSVNMVNNCTTVGEAPPPHRQARTLAKAEKRVERICSSVRAGIRHVDKGIPLANWFFSGVLRRKAVALIPSAAAYFVADGNCNDCGVCVKVCPMRNIGMVNDKPQWRQRCEQCYACLQWCPKEAILVRGKKTEGRRRYRHPAVRLADIMGRTE